MLGVLKTPIPLRKIVNFRQLDFDYSGDQSLSAETRHTQ